MRGKHATNWNMPRTEQITLGGVWGHRALDGCWEDSTNIFLLPWRTTGFDYALRKLALVWFSPWKARADVVFRGCRRVPAPGLRFRTESSTLWCSFLGVSRQLEKGLRPVGCLCCPLNTLWFLPMEAKATWGQGIPKPKAWTWRDVCVELWGTFMECYRVLICVSFGGKKESPGCESPEFVLWSWKSFEKAKHMCWPSPQSKYSLCKLIILAGIPFFLSRRVKWSYGSVKGHLYSIGEGFSVVPYFGEGLVKFAFQNIFFIKDFIGAFAGLQRLLSPPELVGLNGWNWWEAEGSFNHFHPQSRTSQWFPPYLIKFLDTNTVSFQEWVMLFLLPAAKRAFSSRLRNANTDPVCQGPSAFGFSGSPQILFVLKERIESSPSNFTDNVQTSSM